MHRVDQDVRRLKGQNLSAIRELQKVKQSTEPSSHSGVFVEPQCTWALVSKETNYKVHPK